MAINETELKLVNILLSNDKVSLKDDIIPALLDKFKYEVLCDRTNTEIEYFMKHALQYVYNVYGIVYFCIPKFDRNRDEVVITDFIYEKLFVGIGGH